MNSLEKAACWEIAMSLLETMTFTEARGFGHGFTRP